MLKRQTPVVRFSAVKWQDSQGLAFLLWAAILRRFDSLGGV